MAKLNVILRIKIKDLGILELTGRKVKGDNDSTIKKKTFIEITLLHKNK